MLCVKILCEPAGIRETLSLLLQKGTYFPGQKQCRNILKGKGMCGGQKNNSFPLKARGSLAGKLHTLFIRNSHEEVPKVGRTVFQSLFTSHISEAQPNKRKGLCKVGLVSSLHQHLSEALVKKMQILGPRPRPAQAGPQESANSRLVTTQTESFENIGAKESELSPFRKQ